MSEKFKNKYRIPDEFVLMPNHLHAIVILDKYGCKSDENRIMVPNDHDHIIRNETEYRKISEYIIANPENWEEYT